MRTETIKFPDQESVGVFPEERSDLAQAIEELGLLGEHPVIVLIGGEITEKQMDVTRLAIQFIAQTAEDMNAIILCGGTDLGVMAEIGHVRSQNGYKFPLVGITLEELVTWPGGPTSMKFLGLGKERWQLGSHYSHFILVPGSQLGDESLWIGDATRQLSKGHQSVTILINGEEVSRKDIEVSLENGRPVIVLSNTGKLADELARQTERNSLITVVPVVAKHSIAEDLRAALSVNEKGENSLIGRD